MGCIHEEKGASICRHESPWMFSESPSLRGNTQPINEPSLSLQRKETYNYIFKISFIACIAVFFSPPTC